MDLHSYHIFMFPFKWEMKSRKELTFSERTSIKNIELSPFSPWENLAKPKTPTYQNELYNEMNFFYDFVHQTLYDTDSDENIIQHYERIETYKQPVTFKIHVVAGGDTTYELRVKSINLNLYGTGVGVLLFYLQNYQYEDFNDILRINQYGRRIYPPFLDLNNGVTGTKGAELADYIAIEGLNGNPDNYFEDFTGYNSEIIWKPAKFIKTIIEEDFSTDIQIFPVVDDRMFVMCWYGNNALAEKIKDNNLYQAFKKSDDWYKYLFIDGGEETTCQNDEVQAKLLKRHTYDRWQKKGTIYGCSRYSMVCIADNGWFARNILLTHFRTMYARLAELTLVQRASILKFSDEVTQISSLTENEIAKLQIQVSELYGQYIKFINKVHFREVTAQEQGIELYDKLQKLMCISEQAHSLDTEIEELHNYVSIIEDKSRNKNLELLTIISAVFLIPSFAAAFLSMEIFKTKDISGTRKYIIAILFAMLIGALSWFTLRRMIPKIEKATRHRIYFYLIVVLVFLITVISLLWIK